ncbi:Phospholipase A(2) [Caenorhabditis elegans]|uniref:Phospholipase A(2) n=1 Tax=Caenorhabditis elegans TaxID=6239 RepID=Q18339_CAEEL|nr:Phospholipase A(2) [Caenorhabditis elegans]CCD64150.1 Phospholipase A(2) [Caenorhabditis elegans]|eukprot:NP_500864.2 Uncharacterized protein CELE_C31H1.5 [Caenorhabditis elegans]
MLFTLPLLLLLHSVIAFSTPEVQHRSKRFQLPGQQTINPEAWFCGASRFQWKISHEVISQTCDEKAIELNHCCAVHDSCYDNIAQTQEGCDNKFCNCLRNAMTSTKDRYFMCADFVTDAACSLVRKFGHEHYGTRTPDNRELTAFHPATNQTANREYNRLYKSCLGFRKPLISCAYSHLVCTLKMRPLDRYDQSYIQCREDLINCLEDTTSFLKMRENKECSNQLDIALYAIKHDAKLSGLPFYLHYKEDTTTTSTTDTTTTISTTKNTTVTQKPKTNTTNSTVTIEETTLEEKTIATGNHTEMDEFGVYIESEN